MACPTDDGRNLDRAHPGGDLGDRPDRVPARLLERVRSLRGAGGRIRRRLLLHGRELLGVRPTPGVSRVFGVMIDWPIEPGTISLFAASTGLAMLLPSTTGAPLGDDRRLTVRVAARELVLWADEIVDLAMPTDRIAVPDRDRVVVHLLTFEGLLRVSADVDSVAEASSRLARLDRLGRAVLDELHRSAAGEP